MKDYSCCLIKLLVDLLGNLFRIFLMAPMSRKGDIPVKKGHSNNLLEIIQDYILKNNFPYYLLLFI